MKAKIRFFSTLLIIAAIATIACRDPQSSETGVQADTIYVGSLLESGKYYYLSSSGINGVDTLANMRLKFIDLCDTCENGWRTIIFSACPESTIYNALDIIITHADDYQGLF